MARRRIVIANVAAPGVKGLRHGEAYDAESDDANEEAIEAGEIVRDQARAKRGVVPGADFGVAPGKAAQQAGSGGNGVFRYSDIAAAGNVGDGDAQLLHGVQIEPVETRAGDLHEPYGGAFEERARKLGTDGGNDEDAYLLHQRGDIGIVWSTIGDAKGRRGQSIGTLEIRFRTQAEYLECRGG